jgi:uncharacterized coiled-coil protein SlyX
MTQENTSRNIKVIALAIICIILAASTIGVLALYLPNQTQLAEKDQTIASLNQEITALELQLTRLITNASQVSELNSQIAYLNAQLAAFNDTYTDLQLKYYESQSLLHLEKTEIIYDDSLTQDADTTTVIFNKAVSYAGYIIVTATSNSSSTYAQISYTYDNLTFNYNKTIGESGTALLPMLPATIEVSIGNLNPADGNEVNATATIYY